MKLTEEEWTDLLQLVETQGEYTEEPETKHWSNIYLKLQTYYNHQNDTNRSVMITDRKSVV